jgi:hypothetical protein
MRGLQRCDHHEKAHEKAVHLPTSVTPGRPVEVPATQLHCPSLHFIYRRYQFEAPRYGDRASCSSCMLHPKRAFRSGGLDFFPLLINVTTSGTSWPRQPTRIHHDAQVCRRLGVDNRGGWVTSTRITGHLLFIFISLYSSAQAVFQAQAVCIQALALKHSPRKRRPAALHAALHALLHALATRLSHTATLVVVMFTGVCQQECPKVLW